MLRFIEGEALYVLFYSLIAIYILSVLNSFIYLNNLVLVVQFNVWIKIVFSNIQLTKSVAFFNEKTCILWGENENCVIFKTKWVQPANYIFSCNPTSPTTTNFGITLNEKPHLKIKIHHNQQQYDTFFFVSVVVMPTS